LTKVLLIRHGQSVANSEGRLQGCLDSPLTERGREQAHALARRLVREGWSVSAIHASDLVRAAETAAILGGALQAPLLLDERLREYDVGVLTGLNESEIKDLYPEIWHTLRHSPEWPAIPGEEGSHAFRQRITSVLDNIRSNHDRDGAVAVVSHGRTLSMLLAQLLGIDHDRRMMFRFGNTSLSVVELYSYRVMLASLNDLCHLEHSLR
jgi:broad specificity phosphatase PhoE